MLPKEVEGWDGVGAGAGWCSWSVGGVRSHLPVAALKQPALPPGSPDANLVWFLLARCCSTLELIGKGNELRTLPDLCKWSEGEVTHRAM